MNEPKPEPDQPTAEGKPSTPNEPTPDIPRPITLISETFASLKWSGDVPPQKWMNFYTKVLSRFVTGSGLKLTVRVEVTLEGGVSKQKVDEAKSALRELGLDDTLKEE